MPLLVLGGLAYLNGIDPVMALVILETLLETQPVQVVVVPLIFAGIVGLIFGLHARSARRFIRRARTLTYAITDRRVLILADGEIETEFRPGELGLVDREEREPGYQDLLFVKRTGTSGQGESLMSRELRRIGFKALPDAEHVEEVVERWREAHLTGVERGLSDFLTDDGPSAARTGTGTEAGPAGEGPWSSEGALEDEGFEAADFDGDDEVRTIRGGRYGLSLKMPKGWEAKVRHRRKPYGTIFLDNLKWVPAHLGRDWNVVKVEGPFQTTVEVHVDALTEPTSTFEKAVNSTLVKWVTGEIVESDPDVRRGRFRGWSMTRRLLQPQGADRELEQAGLYRVTTLFDGVIQLGFVSHWPATSEALRKTVDRIEESVSVQSEGVEPRAPTAPASASASAVLRWGGRLVTVTRVGIGLLVFGLGVLMGWDQTRRAESYDAALARLQEVVSGEGLPTLPADEVITTQDGRLVHMQGDVVPPVLVDTLTGLAVEGWRMERTVEVSDESSRKPYDDRVFFADVIELGAWELSTYAFASGERSRVSGAVLQEATLEEGWRAEGDYLVSVENPDVRIRYEVHSVPAGPHSVIGVPEEGVLTLDDDLAQAPLMVVGRRSAEEMVAAVGDTGREVQSAWMMWAWVGLMILLRPLARPFILLRGFTEAPFFRRQLLGGAIAASVVLVLAALI